MKYICETSRLLIRETHQEDADFIVKLLNSKGWLQYIGDRKVKKREDGIQYISSRFMASYAEFGFGFWAVIEKESQKAIGICGIVKRPTLEDVDLGYAFLPEYFGKGYAFEATSAILEVAKTKFDISTLIAIVQPDNLRSIKLLEKLSFSYERDTLFEDGALLALYKRIL